ncbi:MAG: superoxide dismutase [Nitrospirae bacterium GWD2_57_9]|nr:MAG: superoxide dismutase [Nitrospirae bacterium GWD2_57_9]OGW50590.1 MAG: superoxide dismutase [Nitrospirae bacterium GWC2_57_9]
MKGLTQSGILIIVLAFAATVSADETVVQMNLINERGIGKAIGMIALSDTTTGLKLTPALSGLTPGFHGFHVHERPDCGPGVKDGKIQAGIAAGEHYDPAGTGKHEGPAGKGHLGDLPYLTVGQDGKASTVLLAPRLKLSDIKGRSFMIHAGEDNYKDEPAPLGGGGGRVACGVIK